MSVNDGDLNEVADEDEKLTDPKGNVLGEPHPEMVPGENLKMAPPRPAFGGRKLLDLKTGMVQHPSLGETPLEDFVTEPEPLEPGSRPGTERRSGADTIPPFELPKDDDDPAGAVPAHHTREEEHATFPHGPRKWDEESQVEVTKQVLADLVTIAPDISKAVKSLFSSFITDGFSAEQALALTQTVIDKKIQNFL